MEWSTTGMKYDVISCLNVLDRCEKPITLLNQIKSSLKPGGLSVISFVIPFNPYVEFGKNLIYDVLLCEIFKNVISVKYLRMLL